MCYFEAEVNFFLANSIPAVCIQVHTNEGVNEGVSLLCLSRKPEVN